MKNILLPVAVIIVGTCSLTLHFARLSQPRNRDGIEDAMFKAGVQSAINAHLTYMQTEMLKGNLPSRAGMEVRVWENQARIVWLNQNPSSRVSAPSANSLFPE